MNKEERNAAFAKLVDDFQKKFKRIKFRERLMLRIAFDFGVDAGIESQNVPELKAKIAALIDQVERLDFFYEGNGFTKRGLTNPILIADYIEEIEHQAGFRCNQELKAQIKKMQCCGNCGNENCTSKYKGNAAYHRQKDGFACADNESWVMRIKED